MIARSPQCIDRPSRIHSIAPIAILPNTNSHFQLESPLTVKAKAKLQVQVMPAELPSRRSTIAACDAPPPYSSGSEYSPSPIKMDTHQSGSNRRRNRSTGSAPATNMAFA